MVLIKRAGLFTLFFLLVFSLFPQNKPVLLSAEIASIEKKLSDSKLPPAERKNALETIARLYELSGNAEKAAETWKGAAAAVSGNTGYGALLQSARCFAAIGEFDKAEAALKPVLAVENNSLLRNNARVLAAQLEALQTGNTAMLSSLLNNPDFAGQKPALYYSLWRISADPQVRSAMASRLLAEFPQSPEGRIVRDDTAVSASPAALWLLQTDISSQAVNPVLTPANPILLQTGVFSLEENAKNMANKLNNAGFRAVIIKKTVNGKDHWTVGVEGGPDPSHTMQLLKDKGFESFPTY